MTVESFPDQIHIYRIVKSTLRIKGFYELPQNIQFTDKLLIKLQQNRCLLLFNKRATSQAIVSIIMVIIVILINQGIRT